MANGPASFTFDIAAPVQSAGPIAPAQAMLGVSGNTGPSSVPLTPGIDMSRDNSDKTLDVLMKLGSDYLAPRIAAARQQKAAEGVVAAMQGMSASTMQDEDVFGGLFGDPVTVAAARQVEKMNAVNAFNVSLAEQMSDIRKMDPAEFRKWYPSHMQQFTTGDPQSDAMITQAFMERMPQTVDMHTKAHTQYRQEVAEEIYSNDLNTWGKALEADAAAFQTGGMSQDAYLGTKQSFASRLAGPGGIHTEVYPKWVNRAYKRFAADGNLQALQIMEDTGVLEATQTDEQYATLLKVRDAAENKVSARSPALLAPAADRGTQEFHIGNGTSPLSSVEEVVAWAHDYNRNFMDTYGGSKPPYTIEAIGKLVEDWHAGKAKAQQRALRSSDDITGAVDAHYNAILGGIDMSMKGFPGQTAFVERAAQDLAIQRFADDPKKLATLIDKSSNTWPAVQAKIAPALDLLRRGEWGPQVAESMGFIAQMAQAGGEQLLGRYLQEDAGPALSMLQLGGLESNPEKLAELTKQLAVHKWARIPQDDIKEMEGYIYDAADKGMWNTVKSVFGAGEYANFNLTDGGRKALARILAPLAARAAHGTARDPARAARVAAGMVQGNLDIVAGIPVMGAKLADPNARTLEAAVNALIPVNPLTRTKERISQSSENYQRAVNSVIAAKMAQFPGAFSMFSSPEAERATWLGSKMSLDMVGADGNSYPVEITPEEVRDALRVVQAAPPRVPTPVGSPLGIPELPPAVPATQNFDLM